MNPLILLVVSIASAALMRWFLNQVHSFQSHGTIVRSLVGLFIGVLVYLIWLSSAHFAHWFINNGASFVGMCPGHAPDIPPVACNLFDYMTNHFIGSAFALFGILVLGVFWFVGWILSWMITSYILNSSVDDTSP